MGNGCRRTALVKLTRLASRGISVAELRVPVGFSEADTTNRIGKSEKASARIPTRCRQPDVPEPAALGAAVPDDLRRLGDAVLRAAGVAFDVVVAHE